MDAGRGHETLEFETKDFAISGTMRSIEHHVFIASLHSPSPTVVAEGPDGCLRVQWVVLQDSDTEFEEPACPQQAVSKPTLCARGRPYFFLSCWSKYNPEK